MELLLGLMRADLRAGIFGNLTNLRLLDNHVYANGVLGIVGGGICGATGNMVEAEIARNTLSGNGSALAPGAGLMKAVLTSSPRRTT